MINYIPDRDSKGNIILGKIKIAEESDNANTGGTFQAKGFEFDIQANTDIQKFDISFPFPISLFSAEWIHKPGMDGDKADFIINPDTTIGTITSDVSIGDTVINVSQTVVDNTTVGRELKLFDGTNTDDLGCVIAIDTDNLTVTVEKAATQNFTFENPTTYVKQNIYMVKGIFMEDYSMVQLGKDVVGGSYIPANYVLRLNYHNNGTAKKFRIILEYKY